MSPGTAQLEMDVPLVATDPRWDLVQRIVGSATFVKSPRLCSFLVYICTLYLKGRGDEISELNIGEALFERPPSYDPSIDGIVRSHASRLRQRLEQYFNEEGVGESLVLSVPKGGYTPVFKLRLVASLPAEFDFVPAQRPLNSPPFSLSSEEKSTPNHHSLLVWILGVALAVACLSMTYLLMRPVAGGAAPAASVMKHPLWSRLFGPDHSTMIVASDTGLTSLETLTGKSVTLAEYLSGDYRSSISPRADTSAEMVRILGARRYTSIVDLDIVVKLCKFPGIPLNRILLRYAKDVRPNDFKSGPVILLGAQEGTPWVELFEKRMNFVIRHDRQGHLYSVLNRSPQGDEAAHYDAVQEDAQPKVYGVVALRPNLEGSGQILIIEGTSMAGTESAADFAFDDARLLPFLDKIRDAKGTIPYFELLLQSTNMNGNASQSEIVTYRTSVN